jgi:choline transport protein
MGLEVLEAMKSNEQNYEEPVHVKVAGEELGPHTVK